MKPIARYSAGSPVQTPLSTPRRPPARAEEPRAIERPEDAQDATAPRLTRTAWRLLEVLAWYCRRFADAHPSQAQLAANLKCAKSSIKRPLMDLRRAGYITTRRAGRAPQTVELTQHAWNELDARKSAHSKRTQSALEAHSSGSDPYKSTVSVPVKQRAACQISAWLKEYTGALGLDLGEPGVIAAKIAAMLRGRPISLVKARLLQMHSLGRVPSKSFAWFVPLMEDSLGSAIPSKKRA